ncbi:MAG: SDR family oxidoreductase [Proteobacteria bacterium]|nr:SDR family oxidoreductase [Pseudomonadota bacterium]MBI3497780.1 SDR family oxidoreductase [Pseudomonadota bacterium]
MRLQDKVAIVTGAGSGFGEGIAKRFAAEGAKIVVNDVNHQAGDKVARDIKAAGGTAMFLKADVANSAEVKEMVARTLAGYGRVDCMVNNAGITHRNRPMLEVGEEEFDRIFAVNVKAIYLSAVHVVPVMRAQGGGSIITTASTAGLRPRPGLTWYNGSKGAAITLTKSMAAELAKDNIRVNCLCPVIGETGLTEMFMGVPDTPENRQRFLSTIPLGRMSKPSDIANAALYLASDEASFITGVALEVDGGRCI